MLCALAGFISAAVVSRTLVFDDAENLEVGIDYDEVGALLVDPRVGGAVLTLEELTIGHLAQYTSTRSEGIGNDGVKREDELLLGLVEEGFSREPTELV
jgi:hypothetical protein